MTRYTKNDFVKKKFGVDPQRGINFVPIIVKKNVAPSNKHIIMA